MYMYLYIYIYIYCGAKVYAADRTMLVFMYVFHARPCNRHVNVVREEGRIKGKVSSEQTCTTSNRSIHFIW